MKAEIQVFKFAQQNIEFDLSNEKLMVNATEMAKPFGKLTKDFLLNDKTKAFINECLNKDNSPYLNVVTEEDLVTSKQKSGTWMHRILALKFAAWLDPSFELWVFRTIDEILFAEYRKLEQTLKERAQRRNKMEELQKKLRENPEFLELERLAFEEKQSAYQQGKVIKNQLNLFMESTE